MSTTVRTQQPPALAWPVARFPDLLANLRRRWGGSQSTVAVVAGYDHSYVNRLESGQRSPSRQTVVDLAAALALTQDDTDDLLAAAGYLPSPAGILRLAAALALAQGGQP